MRNLSAKNLMYFLDCAIETNIHTIDKYYTYSILIKKVKDYFKINTILFWDSL